MLAFRLASAEAPREPATAPRPQPPGYSLEQILTLAREHNPEIVIARHSVESARANIQIAAARPNPNLTLQAVSINPKGVGSGPLYDKTVDSSVRVDQLFERGMKREMRCGNAEALALAAQADLSETVRLQLGTVTQAYYDLKLATEKHRITRETVALYQDTLKAADLRYKAGDVSRTDVARLRVDASRARSDALQAKADLLRSQQALATLLGGVVPAQQFVTADRWPSVQSTPEPETEQVSTPLADARPDVRGAWFRVQAADAGRKLAKAQTTRDVTVGVQIERFPGPGNSGNTVGISIAVPLFIAYNYEGEIRKAESDRDAAQASLNKTRALARADLYKTDTDMRAAGERANLYRKGLVDDARRVADAAEFAYKKGAMGLLDLLDARRTFRAVQLEAASAEADLAKAAAAYGAAREIVRNATLLQNPPACSVDRK